MFPDLILLYAVLQFGKLKDVMRINQKTFYSDKIETVQLFYLK